MTSASSAGAETITEESKLGLLIIEIAGERYGVRSSSVHEIVRHRQWTAVPGAPPTLPGIISQRGLILPIVEMRALLGLPETELQRSARFVVVQHNEIDMALLVDSVIDLASIADSTFSLPPGATESRRDRFVRGMTDIENRPLALLDLDAVIAALREGS